jgi:SAM-dependent methyltransferase
MSDSNLSRDFLERLAAARWFIGQHPIEMFPGSSVLEVGFGGGQGLIAASEAGARALVGVDPEPFGAAARRFGLPVDPEQDFLQWAEMYPTLFCRMEFYQATLEDSALVQETFDVCLAQDTLEHVKDIRGIASKCFDLLKPGGYFLSDTGPLYYSRLGSHLWSCFSADVVNWVHLRKDFEELLIRYSVGPFFLWEFEHLNRATALDIRGAILEAGFQIEHELLRMSEQQHLEEARQYLRPEFNTDQSSDLLRAESYAVCARKPK